MKPPVRAAPPPFLRGPASRGACLRHAVLPRPHSASGRGGGGPQASSGSRSRRPRLRRRPPKLPAGPPPSSPRAAGPSCRGPRRDGPPAAAAARPPPLPGLEAAAADDAVQPSQPGESPGASLLSVPPGGWWDRGRAPATPAVCGAAGRRLQRPSGRAVHRHGNRASPGGATAAPAGSPARPPLPCGRRAPTNHRLGRQPAPRGPRSAGSSSRPSPPRGSPATELPPPAFSRPPPVKTAHGRFPARPLMLIGRALHIPSQRPAPAKSLPRAVRAAAPGPRSPAGSAAAAPGSGSGSGCGSALPGGQRPPAAPAVAPRWRLRGLLDAGPRLTGREGRVASAAANRTKSKVPGSAAA